MSASFPWAWGLNLLAWLQAKECRGVGLYMVPSQTHFTKKKYIYVKTTTQVRFPYSAMCLYLWMRSRGHVLVPLDEIQGSELVCRFELAMGFFQS